MKIGAGGLQSIIMSDVARALETPDRPRQGLQETLAQAQGQDKTILKQELNRALEKLNHLAEVLNYPFQLVIKGNPPNIKVVLRDRRTGKEKEIELSELDQLAAHLESAKGVHLDSYT